MQSHDSFANIESLKALFPEIYSGKESDSVFTAFIREPQSLSFVTSPFSFSGFLLLYCIEGSAHINVDQEVYEIKGSSSIVIFPDAVVSLVNNDNSLRTNVFVLALSLDVIDQMPVDFKSALPSEVLIFRRALIDLSPEIERVLRSQISLANTVSTMGLPFCDEIARSMFSITFFMLMSLMISPVQEKEPRNSSHAMALVSRFIQLLKDNYKTHRDISYYSDILGVTPNYLSQRLRLSTGHNASDWIDRYLLSESKNLLLMTTKPVHVISDELNFSGQASFAKYFKDRTGMTPSQFRRR